MPRAQKEELKTATAALHGGTLDLIPKSPTVTPPPPPKNSLEITFLVPYYPDCPQTHYVASAELELLIGNKFQHTQLRDSFFYF